MATVLGRSSLAVQTSTDAAAAIGIESRREARKVKHIETARLWLQKHVTDRRVGPRRKTETTTLCTSERNMVTNDIATPLGKLRLPLQVSSDKSSEVARA